jgi:hypothetical protein
MRAGRTWFIAMLAATFGTVVAAQDITGTGEMNLFPGSLK